MARLGRRLVEAFTDVTVGTAIVLVHAVLAERSRSAVSLGLVAGKLGGNHERRLRTAAADHGD